MTREQFNALPAAVRKAATGAYMIASNELHAAALHRRPKPKVYEIYHESEAMRVAILAHLSIDPCASESILLNIARDSIGLKAPL